MIALVSSLVMMACSEESPDCGDPKSTICELILVDSVKNVLVGTKYDTDSIQLQVNKALIPLNFDNGIIRFNFAGYDLFNATDYILKLNYRESDTLNVKIRMITTQCWTVFSIDTVSYNDQVLQSISENKYEIIK